MAEHEYRTVVMKAASIGGKVWSLCVEVQALAERRSPNRKVGQRCPSAPGRGGSYSEGVFPLRKRRYIRGALGQRALPGADLETNAPLHPAEGSLNFGHCPRNFT